jgi:hypothetical protein
MEQSGYLITGHPYTIINGVCIVDYMPYSMYQAQKRREENPELAKWIDQVFINFMNKWNS